MGLPAKLLSRDEVVVRHMHTHPKVLFGRIILEILWLVCAIAATALAPKAWNPWLVVAIWMLFVIISVPLLLLPWLRWWFSTYTITTKRVITRAGIFNKTGHDLPLSRISDVQQECSLIDRLFGAGTLFLQTSANDPLVLNDVPAVETVQVEISNLLFHDVQGAIDVDPTD